MVSGKGPGAPTKPRQSSPRKKNGGGEHPETTGPATTGPAEPKTAKRHGALAQVELTEEQQQALFHDHLRNYKNRLERLEAARLAHDQEKSAIRNFLKLCKSEGTTEDDLKFVLRLEEEGGEERFRAEVERRFQLARWGAHKVGFQGEMFEDRRPAVDAAFVEGKAACMRGDMRKSPYGVNTEQERSWYAGYDNGQAVLASGFRKAAPSPSPDGTPVGSQPSEAPSQDLPTATEVADAVGDGVKESLERAGITSGQAIPRSQFQQQLREQTAEVDKQLRSGGLRGPEPIGDQPPTHNVV